MDLDDSLVGLNKDKMMKVSDFRTKINVALMDSDQSQSLQINDTVKYLHATKFDIAKAEEIYRNYQRYKDLYKVSDLKSNGQALNSEMRTRKLEVLGTRDSKGSLILLYTASRHTPRSHDSPTAMQLFFLIFDQISESMENQSKGITIIIDMRDSLASSFDGHYADSLFTLLHNGYPIYINSIYVIEAPSWFKSLQKLRSYTNLQQNGKIKHCTVSSLSSFIPPSSLPNSLDGTAGMPSFTPSSEAMTHPLSPVHNTQITPPPRRTKPVVVHDDDSKEAIKGCVNKMKERFNPPTRSSTAGQPMVVNKPATPKSKPKTNGASSIHQVKGPKPLPPPRNNNKMAVLPPNTREDGSKRLPFPFMKSKSYDDDTNGDDLTKKKREDDLVEPISTHVPMKTPARTIKTTTKATTTPTTETTTKAVTTTTNAMTTKTTAITKTVKTITKAITTKATTTTTTNNELSKHKAQLKLRNNESRPPPSYDAPSPPSESESKGVSQYVNINISKLCSPTVEDNTILPYMVTTISSGEPVKATPITPPASSNHIAKVKMREPITTIQTHELTTPTLNDHDTRKKPSCYENIFFTREVEDEGECLNNDDESIYENFGPDEGNRWMSVDELDQYISKKEKTGLSAEYYKIKNDPLSCSADIFKKPYNTSKNRYKDVVCYDTTRVVLNELDGVEGSDYIHANYVNGFEKKQAFILTQGPLKRTVCDYWRMLWEKEVFVVVMTTKCVEMGKLKCAQYWPNDDKSPVVFGGVTITVIEYQQRSSFESRKLSVQCNGETRILIHYQYIAWPDYGVPNTGKDVVELLYTAREMQESFGKYVKNPGRFPVYGPPLVIHCSAGIGRSGTFCALDYCIDELRVKGRVNIQHCVRQLRQQRAFAIQTDEQYKFCYDTVLEYGKYLKKVLKM